MMRICEMRGFTVVDERGVKLGHFADLRCNGTRRADGGQARATAQRIVWGAVGLLERLGVRALVDRTIDWRDVIAIERERIVVRTPRSTKRHKR